MTEPGHPKRVAPARGFFGDVKPKTTTSTGGTIRPTASHAPVPPPSPVQAATKRLSGLVVSGGLLYVIGGALFLGCWLARSSALVDADTDPGALSFLILLGALAASVGSALLLVGLIGWGVKLGREAADV
jgi:hypothetical protein